MGKIETETYLNVEGVRYRIGYQMTRHLDGQETHEIWHNSERATAPTIEEAIRKLTVLIQDKSAVEVRAIK